MQGDCKKHSKYHEKHRLAGCVVDVFGANFVVFCSVVLGYAHVRLLLALLSPFLEYMLTHIWREAARGRVNVLVGTKRSQNDELILFFSI